MKRLQLTRKRMMAMSALSASLALTLAAAPAQAVVVASIFYTGGAGATVYGVAPYGLPAQPTPTFFGNNFTGFNDIMTSPGHGFLTANPIVANNIFQSGPGPLPRFSFKIGGGNGFGSFGAAATAITGPRIFFAMRDAGHPGAGSLSYGISSWTSHYVVGGAGFSGNLGTFLSVGGRLPTVLSADAVSLVSNYYLNGVYVGQTTPLVLAAAGNGNFQAFGGSFSGLVFGPGGTWRGLAIDNVAATLPAGEKLKVVSTLTEFADPAMINVLPIDLNPFQGAQLPNFAFSGTAAAAPEPATWAMMLAGLAAVGAALRMARRPNAEALAQA